MEALGKMTIATLGTKPKMVTVLDDDALKAVNNKVFLARIIGTARGLKMAIDTRGEPVAGLTGQFLATLPDGKEFTSGVLYLPGGLQEMIQDPLEAGINANDKSTAIEFAMDLFSIKATNAAGYSFQATLLGDAAQADPFAALKARVGTVELPTVPKLSAPQTKEAEAAQKALSEKAASDAAAKDAPKDAPKS